MLPPGWSIHEIGTARMGDDPKTSVTDRFCRLHDVPNVYLADAAPFVSGGTQNTTWSILAMCWRTMDYLKERLSQERGLASGGARSATARARGARGEREGHRGRIGRRPERSPEMTLALGARRRRSGTLTLRSAVG